MKKIVFFILILFPFLSQSQLVLSSAEIMSLGGSGQTTASPWAAYYNQANLARLSNKINAGIFYHTFLSIPGLSDKAMSFAYKISDNNALGFDYMFSGIDTYNQQKLGFAYGQKIANNFYIGGQINLHLINQPNYYGDIYTATGEISVLYINDNITGIENLSFGARAYNFTYGLLDKYQPVIVNLGLNVNITHKVGFYSEVEQNSVSPIIVRWGAHYIPVEMLSLMLGGYLQDNIYTFTFGMGLKYKWAKINFGFESHPLRGTSGAIGIIIGI